MPSDMMFRKLEGAYSSGEEGGLHRNLQRVDALTPSRVVGQGGERWIERLADAMTVQEKRKGYIRRSLRDQDLFNDPDY